jgi:hypothetical protein
MKKLEDIPKKQIFSVPEGYFDKLPQTIQARVSRKTEERPFFIQSLKYALPVIAMAAFGIFWYSQTNTQLQDAESILASVQTEALVAYLDESDLSTEDILENIEFTTGDVEAIESEVSIFPLDDLELNDVGETDIDTL